MRTSTTLPASAQPRTRPTRRYTCTKTICFFTTTWSSRVRCSASKCTGSQLSTRSTISPRFISAITRSAYTTRRAIVRVASVCRLARRELPAAIYSWVTRCLPAQSDGQIFPAGTTKPCCGRLPKSSFRSETIRSCIQGTGRTRPSGGRGRRIPSCWSISRQGTDTPLDPYAVRARRCPACSLLVVARRNQLYTSNLNPIARGELRALHALAVDERPVGAVEIAYFEAAACSGGQPAMNSGHERGVDAEVSARCATERPDAAGENPEPFPGFTVTNSSQDPHAYQ